jgi:predicted CxxxxCH...CXXCH cytochrome family protein
MKLMRFSAILLLIVTLWGCGSGNSSSPTAIDPTTRKHATPGWFDKGTGGVHPSAYFADSVSCTECHGKDLSGGISKVSCSPGVNSAGCHERFPHNNGFASSAVHGLAAKGPVTATNNLGMAHCTRCHGLEYQGAVGPSCIACHQTVNPGTQAPHAANWKLPKRHSLTAESNASACFKCHAGGQYSHAPKTPAQAGTEPGCFNGTLCHNQAITHALPFIAAESHGNEIKSNGWYYCDACHGVSEKVTGYRRFNVPVGRMANGCETCHKKDYIAHPQMWLQGRGDGTPTTIGGTDAVKNTSHVNVSPAIIKTSCTAECHGNTTASSNPVIPSCATANGKSINGFLCHFTSPFTSAGQSEGCRSCHNFSNTTDFVNYSTNKHKKHIASISANWVGLTPPCLACHASVNGRGVTHANGNVDVAVLPQFGVSAVYNANTKSCSGVTCHGSATNATPSWTAKNVTCTDCHGTPPNNTSSPNTANAHPKHSYSCSVCHNGAGSGTIKHINGVADVLFDTTQAGASASFNTSAKTCSNITCHGGNTTPAWGAVGSSSNCSICHGGPPTGPDGSTFPNAKKAHPNHMKYGFSCSVCHKGAGEGTALHVNGTVDVALDTASPLAGADATFNKSLVQCSNTYCHGLTLTGGGTNKNPTWTTSGIGCGSCHGYPPSSMIRGGVTVTHVSSTTCNVCHTHVNSTNDGFTAAGIVKHVNGTVEGTSAPHTVPYPGYTHRSAPDFSICGGCHDLNGNGGTGFISPNCRSCHTLSSPLNAGVSVGCGSCHAAPPATGAHTTHTSLSGVACDACHSGAGSGQLSHGVGLSVTISPDFKAETGGNPAYNGTIGSRTGTCANISCHGGQTTPGWSTTGNYPLLTHVYTPQVNLCLNCHQLRDQSTSSSLQYNSIGSLPVTPGSTLNNSHYRHLNDISLIFLCVDCHDQTKLTNSNHYSSLSVKQLPDAAFSIRAELNYIKPTCFSVPDIALGQTSHVSVQSCHTSSGGGTPPQANWKP